MEKAYKLLALKKNISNNKAKELIDRGLVYIIDKKVKIARALVPLETEFRVEKPADIKIIYEDEKIIVVNKPAMLDSSEVEAELNRGKLLHRLDRETSGVLLLAKDETFYTKALDEFRNRRVKKEYVAWVEGTIYEEEEITASITTIKKGRAISKIDPKGLTAHTKIYPSEVQGKKSKIDIEISTGRTHQIRVHLSHIGHPIVGDEQYGSKTQAKRVLLHAKKIKLFKQEFEAVEPKDILRYK